MNMSIPKKVACIAGLVACVFLCVFDWLTSVDGVHQILGGRGGATFIATFFPPVFATLALCVNTLCGYFLAMFRRNEFQFTEFNAAAVMVVVAIFMAYDVISSFIGMLSIYGEMTIDSWDAIQAASSSLGGIGCLFVLIMTGLLAMSPFLCGVFGDALSEHAGSTR